MEVEKSHIRFSKLTSIFRPKSINDAGEAVPINNFVTRPHRYLFFTVIWVTHKFICEFKLFSIVVLIIYLTLGAFIFSMIENKEPVTSETLAKLRKEFVHTFQGIANLNDEQMSNISQAVNDILNRYYEYLLKSPLEDYEDDTSGPWTFVESLSFCFYVVTTIGQGSLVPRTIHGKVITMIYAIIGISLCLNAYFRLAGLLMNSLDKCIHKIKCTFGVKTEIDRASLTYSMRNENVTFCLSCSALIATLFLGSYIFTLIEGWSYIDSIYFACLTLTTIGFGDVSSHTNVLLIFFIPFFFFGYTLLVMMATSIKTIFKKKKKRFVGYLTRKLQKGRATVSSEIIRSHLDGTGVIGVD